MTLDPKEFLEKLKEAQKKGMDRILISQVTGCPKKESISNFGDLNNAVIQGKTIKFHGKRFHGEQYEVFLDVGSIRSVDQIGEQIVYVY